MRYNSLSSLFCNNISVALAIVSCINLMPHSHCTELWIWFHLSREKNILCNSYIQSLSHGGGLYKGGTNPHIRKILYKTITLNTYLLSKKTIWVMREDYVHFCVPLSSMTPLFFPILYKWMIGRRSRLLFKPNIELFQLKIQIEKIK